MQATSTPKPTQYQTPAEFAEQKRISRMSVYRRIKDGSIRAERIGGLWRIPVAQ